MPGVMKTDTHPLEIIFFTYGPSDKASTWSNVPYCFSNALIENGCTIHRVDLKGRSHFFPWVFEWLVRKPLSLLYPGFQYDYKRSNFYYYATCLKIFFYARKYRNADWCFFLNFDFVNRYSRARSLVFGDWTFRILIEERLKRKPYFFEKWYIRKQDRALRRADRILCLFPEAADSMRRVYTDLEIHHLDSNVVNTLYKGNIDADLVVRTKSTSPTILFVGKPKYLDGALLLKDAVASLRSRIPSVTLHVIGLTDEQLQLAAGESEFVHCHGYLNKGDDAQRELYYKLMLEATVFCNPSDVWAGYSSTVEAMYYYTPVVTTRYADFVSEFGSDISFGRYVDTLTPESLGTVLESLMTDPDYGSFARNAHERVKDYTWDEYVKKVLRLCRNCPSPDRASKK